MIRPVDEANGIKNRQFSSCKSAAIADTFKYSSEAAMRCVEELTMLPVWVDPEHLAESALHLARGHGLRVLAVLSQGRLAGFVTRDRLEYAPEGARVRQVMIEGGEIIPAGTSVRGAAELFSVRDLDFAAVFSDQRFLGVLIPNMLLGELRRSWDPLTNLPWSDQLREWGIDQLRAGQEITVLFFDLDQFRHYNKTHGHVVGDRVLRSVAEVFRSMVDPSLEVLVRYGGDEFAIATTRSRERALELAEKLCDRVAGLYVAGLEQSVGMSFGLSGGKRTRERENVHYAATLDNLINLASQDCQAKKKALRRGTRAAESVSAGDERPRVVTVSADDAQPDAPVSVYIQARGAVLSGVELRQGRSLIETVARATAAALEKWRPPLRMTIDEVILGDQPRSVSVRARIEEGGAEKVVFGTSPLGEGDLFRATAEATIAAVT